MEIIAAVSHPSKILCVHCGTAFESHSAQDRFCCHGCETVYQIIQNQGLNDYYRLRDANPPQCPVPARTSVETFEYLDDADFIRRLSPDGLRLKLFLEGMSCAACLWLLERIPELCSDAASVRVNMSSSTVEIERIPGGSFARIAKTYDSLGYKPHVIKDASSSLEMQNREKRRELIRIGVAAAATGNIMILAVSLYAGAEGELARQFRWLTAMLAAPVLTYGAWPFYKSALASLKTRRLNLDVPIVAALMAGILMSLWGLTSGRETLYFDSLSTLVFLLLSSRFWLRGVQQNLLDVSNLEEELLTGTVVKLTEQGSREKVSALSLHPGDQVVLQSPAVIPADGFVIEGNGLLDLSVMTGESQPIAAEVGSRVEAGTQALSGSFVIQVEKPAKESRLAAILRDTEASARAKPSIVTFADRVSQWFVGIVITLAFVVIGAFAFTSPFEGLSRALALVIVTCPCVFGMAIPLSMSLAIRNGAKRGIVIKDADAVERLTQISSLYFDKTGTLTFGDFRVHKIESFVEEESLKTHLAALLALEENQTHPIARALTISLTKKNLPQSKAYDVQRLEGGGLQGSVDGRVYAICPCGLKAPSENESFVFSYRLYCGSTTVAEIEIGDELRPEANAVLSWATDQAMNVFLLSGDQTSVVNAIAERLKLSRKNVFAKASPEDKAMILKSAGASSAMIGDGANDAAALAAAGVGIAVRGSMDLSLKAADVYLTKPDLNSLQELFSIAKLTRRAIRRNLAFSATFNIVAGTLALTGLMTPLWAAVFMPLSSLTVLLSALATGKRL